jgi:hypothetical protein
MLVNHISNSQGLLKRKESISKGISDYFLSICQKKSLLRLVEYSGKKEDNLPSKRLKEKGYKIFIRRSE